jgi:hypothetical protein
MTPTTASRTTVTTSPIKPKPRLIFNTPCLRD